MKLRLIAGTVAGLLTLNAAPALAAPVTVDLRIEGATRTIFEGPVTTDVRQFPSKQGLKPCDDGAGQVTRGAVIAASGVPFDADWNDGFGNPTFNTVDGEDVTWHEPTQRFFAEYLAGKPSNDGACTEPVGNGAKVLFAYSAFGDTVLELSGPASVKPGETATLKVTNADGGAPVEGATVAGKATGADGTVTVGPLSTRGDNDFKATADKAVRSNRVRVCVTDGADGACGTTKPTTPGTTAAPDRTAPTAALTGLRDKQTLSRGPRELRGSFADPSGVKTVKLRLTKRLNGKCWYFSGKMERFRGTKCGRGPYFTVGDKADWSYLLPARLGKGRYVLDAIAIDTAGNRTPLERGKTRVVFTVR